MKQQHFPQRVRQAPRRRSAMRVAVTVVTAVCVGLPPRAWAALADLADQPLATAGSSVVQPNLMFVLDTSGSMAWDYLPDEANYSSLCFGDSRLNRIFFDPAETYLPPLRPDGTSYPDSLFTAARDDGFDSGSSAVDLSDVNNLNSPSVRVGGTSRSPINSRFYYARYTTTSAPACSGGTYSHTNFTISTSAALWTAAQRTNYANWYSYYRTRILSMRTAAGRVFATIDPTRYRVGMATIFASGTSDSSQFLNIRDFDAPGQKAAFFSNLYNANSSGWTPLRPALHRAGSYFANKLSGQTVDPVQYSCQRNYTILSTDGYWNTNAEPSSYVPRRLGSTSGIGNFDGSGTSPATPRPLLDDVDSRGRTGGAGVSNSLADISRYFYLTDLRSTALGNCTGAVTGQDVCVDNVSPTPADPATHQHMNTITLGLGLAGTLAYDPNYPGQTSGDFARLRAGTIAWPDPIANTGAERVDDLWHAAVNGHGHYYSATDPAELAASLVRALQSIDAHRGAGAAAATSNLQPVTGDNFVFVASYQSAFWDGNLQAYTIDPVGGDLSATPMWSANSSVTAQTGPLADTRNIYFYRATAPNRLASFTYSNLSAAGLNAPFDNLCPSSGAPKLSQCSGLSAAEKLSATGPNLVSWLRGQSSFENNAVNPVKLFRERAAAGVRNVLGDIISSVPVYVKKPRFKYTDGGYAGFASANASRRAVVYAGANDGMLHAFDATTGQELWAFVPTAVMDKMTGLADYNYAAQHRYLVDGAVTVADVHDGSAWRTVLIGGLNSGGRGYYALDVTNPNSPQALWEFSDTHLGLTFGNPVVTKRKDGRWVVAFTSGYNNVSPGDGNGRLYVLDAVSGARLATLATDVTAGVAAGTTGTPNNLARLNAWIDNEMDNTASRMYAGDMRGNVWRFDFDDNIAPSGREAFLLGQARAAGGLVQPITVKPELTEIVVAGARYPLVSIGTGRYLGSSDIGDTTTQSVYVFKETLDSTALGDLRGNPGMVRQTLVATTDSSNNPVRKISTPPASVNWATQRGWFTDLSLSSGERVDIDMVQQLNMLVVAGNVPDSNACTVGGSSYIYYFDIASGSFIRTSPESVIGHYLGNSLAAGITTFQVSNGNTKTIVVTRKGEVRKRDDPPLAPGSTMRRISWRELM